MCVNTLLSDYAAQLCEVAKPTKDPLAVLVEQVRPPFDQPWFRFEEVRAALVANGHRCPSLYALAKRLRALGFVSVRGQEGRGERHATPVVWTHHESEFARLRPAERFTVFMANDNHPPNKTSRPGAGHT